MNVSSIVVKTLPEHMQEVMDNINTVDYCEVHFNDPSGNIVVTIEGESIEDQMESMKKIQSIEFVSGANLSYSYCEEEVAPALNKINEGKSANL